jgi:4-carboxymuconolactone decarboxylase
MTESTVDPGTINGANHSNSSPHSRLWHDGLAARKAVLGEDHVDRAMSGVSEFSRPMQDLVTEYCWGAIWTRDGLQRRDRSLINLAMLTALNRNHELAVHVRGALRNGCTVEEIQEVLLQASVYVGVPAALESFRVAERVLTELGVDLDAATTSGTDMEVPR